MRIAGVGGCDNDPRLFAGDGHASGAHIEPNPTLRIDVHHGGRNGIAVVHAGLHAGCAPCATGGGAVPCGGGRAPVGVDDGVDIEGDRGCSLNRGPRFNVHAERGRVHLLILCKRYLSSVERYVDSAFIGVECSAKGSCADGRFTCKVGVGVFTVHGGVLHVGVAKGGDFAAGLEPVRVGVVVVVGVVGVANGEAPSRGGRSGNGLVHTLDPPGEQLTLGQVFFKPERGVRDF